MVLVGVARGQNWGGTCEAGLTTCISSKQKNIVMRGHGRFVRGYYRDSTSCLTSSVVINESDPLAWQDVVCDSHVMGEGGEMV